MDLGVAHLPKLAVGDAGPLVDAFGRHGPVHRGGQADRVGLRSGALKEARELLLAVRYMYSSVKVKNLCFKSRNEAV